MRWTLRVTLFALAASAMTAPFAVSRSAMAAKFGAAPVPQPRASQAASTPAVDIPQPTANAAGITIPVLGFTKERLKPMFNDARSGHVHHALDMLAERGTPVVAAVDGTIRKLFFSGAGGITVYQFDDQQSLVYYYAHLDRYADGLREGMRVRRGEVIGYVGTTGNAPAGTPHLHFAIARLTAEKRWWDAEAIDPYPILMERGVTLTTPASAPPLQISGPN